MLVEWLTRGAKLKLGVGGVWVVPLLLGEDGSSTLWFLFRLGVLEDSVVRFLLGGATGPVGGSIILTLFVSALYIVLVLHIFVSPFGLHLLLASVQGLLDNCMC